MDSQEERYAEVAVHCLRVGETCMQQKNYGRAFAHYLLVLKLQPWQKPEIKDNFTLALKEWAEQLEQAGRMHDLFMCYEQACQLFPECEAMLNNMGAHLFRLGYADEAASCFRKALRLCPDFMAARHNLDNLRGHLVDRWHFSMLNDQRRNQAYQQAIEEAVERGFDVVLDIGAGTGLLSMFAAQAGANSVFGCEMSKTMYDLSRDIVRANQMEGDLQLIHKKSTSLAIPADLPTRVTLVVTETFDAGLFGEHILSTLSHAWKHLLSNEDGNRARVIPGGASLYVTALESKSVRIQNKFLYPGLRYIDLGEVKLMCKTSATSMPEELSLSFLSQSPGGASDDPSTCDSESAPEANEEYEPYTCEHLRKLPGGYQLLTDTRVAMDINFNDPEMIDSYLKGYQRELTLQVTQSGRLDALAVWFDLHLDDDLTLTSDPKAGSCWQQAVFPVHVEGQQYVRCGDELTIQCQCQQDRLQMTCTAITRRRHRATSEPNPNPNPSSAFPQRSSIDPPILGDPGSGTSVSPLSSFDVIVPQCENIQFGDCDFFGMQDSLRYRGVSFLCSNDIINFPMQSRPYYARQEDDAAAANVLNPEPHYLLLPSPPPPVQNLPGNLPRTTANNTTEPESNLSHSIFDVEDLPEDASLRRDRLLSEVILMPDTMSICPSNGHSTTLTQDNQTSSSPLSQNGSSASQNHQSHSVNTDPSSPSSSDALKLPNLGTSFLDQQLQQQLQQQDEESDAALESTACSATNFVFSDDELTCYHPQKAPVPQLPNKSGLTNGEHHPEAHSSSPALQRKSLAAKFQEDFVISDSTSDVDSEYVAAPALSGSAALPKPQTSCVFHFERPEIERLNDLEWSDAYCSALQSLKEKTLDGFSILDLTQGASLLPLQAVKLGASQVGVANADSMKEALLRELASTNGLADGSLRFDVGNIEQERREWDVVLSELVEPCGTLCQQVLENLALSRVTCLKPGGVIMPSAARVYGLLIESPSLHQDSSLLSDESTLGLHVADYINEFQMMTHVDIDLSSLKYKRLSDPFEMFSLDFNESPSTSGEIPSFLEQTSQQRITACDFGQVTAVVYWFELDLTENVRLCTLEPTHHWRQAAVMQRCNLDVSTGTELLVTAACKNSFVDVTVKAY